MRNLSRIVGPTTEFVLSESTRAFIEKVASDAAAETLKDDTWRREIREMVRRHFDKGLKKLRSRKRRSRSRKTPAL